MVWIPTQCGLLVVRFSSEVLQDGRKWLWWVPSGCVHNSNWEPRLFKGCAGISLLKVTAPNRTLTMDARFFFCFITAFRVIIKKVSHIQLQTVCFIIVCLYYWICWKTLNPLLHPDNPKTDTFNVSKSNQPIFSYRMGLPWHLSQPKKKTPSLN